MSTPTAGFGKGSRGEALAERGAQLVQLGNNLRKIARENDCAVVVANQVSDRFASLPASSAERSKMPAASQRSGAAWSSSPAQASQPSIGVYDGTTRPPAVLSLDHQLRWMSGWGDSPESRADGVGEKTPALGLTWANQIDCRVALIKGAAFAQGGGNEKLGDPEAEEWAPRRWRRHMRMVFAPWAAPTGEGEKGTEFEIWEGGARAV